MAGGPGQSVGLGSLETIDDVQIGLASNEPLRVNEDIDSSAEACANFSINNLSIFIDSYDFGSLHKFYVFDSIDKSWDEENHDCTYSIYLNPATGIRSPIIKGDVDTPWSNTAITIPILEQ